MVNRIIYVQTKSSSQMDDSLEGSIETNFSTYSLHNMRHAFRVGLSFILVDRNYRNYLPIFRNNFFWYVFVIRIEHGIFLKSYVKNMVTQDPFFISLRVRKCRIKYRRVKNMKVNQCCLVSFKVSYLGHQKSCKNFKFLGLAKCPIGFELEVS